METTLGVNSTGGVPPGLSSVLRYFWGRWLPKLVRVYSPGHILCTAAQTKGM